MKLDLKELADFLKLANKSTYADASAERAQVSRLDSKDYHYEHNDWAFHDTYFGARDFIGAEVVYKRGCAAWGMNYYGVILDAEFTADAVYGFLRTALLQADDETLPVRGPKKYIFKQWEYRLSLTGDLANFFGQEEILYDGIVVYRCMLHGGLVC
ncbi:MAG: DUF5680 domain-containing protein [Negativicutes bacterium]|jgi:hypothetical protein